MPRESESRARFWRRAAEGSVLWRVLAPVRTAWRTGEWLVEQMTLPRADAAHDRTVEEVIRASRVTGAVERVSVLCSTAWRGSATRAVWCRWNGLRATQKPAGLATVVASATALVLRAASTHPAPLTWMVPLGALLFGIVEWKRAPRG